MGIPMIGCNCPVCLSSSPYNQRTRAAALLRVQGKNILLDAGPDIRQQALKYGLTHIDGLLITHTHYDHIGGLDDLRAYHYRDQLSLPCLASEESYEDLKTRCGYLLKGKKPLFSFKILEQERGEVDFLGLRLRYFSYAQTGMKVTGYRLDNFVFMTDIKEYSEEIFEEIQDCEVLVLSALEWKPTRAHIGIQEALEIAGKVKAKKVFLIHIGHELEHEETHQKLPQFVRLAYDGLTITF
ncbi:MAG: MBL fold metallo-hydrolase [Chlamydiae bacterium]|nr:MBL fold metallo-hydrolase [Chlamydiota bacterium]